MGDEEMVLLIAKNVDRIYKGGNRWLGLGVQARDVERGGRSTNICHIERSVVP